MTLSWMRRNAGWLASLPLILIPVLVSNEYYVHSVLCKVCLYAIVVAGLDLVVGYSGDVSVGHAGLFAVGAYTTAILMWQAHWPFPAALAAGVVLSGFFGLLLGVPALRLKGPYLAVATIAFGLIIQTVANEAVELTNGSQGIQDIPPLSIGPVSLDGNRFFYVVYPVLLLVLLGVRRLATSYWSRAFEALKENQTAAECSGVNRYRYKLSAFVLSALLAGLAGGLFIHIDKYIGPPTFSLQLSILFLIMLIFGGTRSVTGNVIGALVVVVLPDLFNNLVDYQLMIFAGLLLLALYFLPRGISGALRALAARVFRGRPGADNGARTGAGAGSASGTDGAIVMRGRGTGAGGGVLLRTEDLTIAFGGLVAVNRLNLSVGRGEVHALIGPNGSGKSTTVNLLSGVYRPSAGRILFDGRPLPAQSSRISRAGLARTFQNVALFGDMTVLDNVRVGLHHTHRAGLWPILFATPAARREEAAGRARAMELLRFVGLEGLAGDPARNLPYGRQRLLEIARALAQDPLLLLLDEPGAGLTAEELREVTSIIARLRARGMAVLLIEHHMDLVMSVSDRITVLDFGQRIAEGTPAEIQGNDEVIRAYLGTTPGGEAAHA